MSIPAFSSPTLSSRKNLSFLFRQADWIFFFFLLLVCNQAMLLIKLAGFAFVYVMRPNLRFRLHQSRLPLLYVLLPIAGLLPWLLHIPDAHNNYVYAFAVGVFSWLLCLAASHQIRLSIEKKGPVAMDATLRLFTLFHFVTCVGQLVFIAFKTKHLNPYDASVPFPYGMSSGDHVFGLLFENSTYNVMVAMMLMLYFIFKNSRIYTLLAAGSALLVFSNFGNIIYAGMLLFLLALGILKSLLQKTAKPGNLWRFAPPRRSLSLIAFLLVLLPALYLVFSPQNFDYFIKEKSRTETTVVNTTTADTGKSTLWQRVQQLDYQKYQHPLSVESSAATRDFANRKWLTEKAIEAMVGKKLSFLETAVYLQSDVRMLLTGSGIGRFSSLAAHRISGGDTGRIFRKIPTYRTPLYLENHGLITKTRLAAPPAQYATSNWCESFYNQLLGEYGLLGALLFLGFYILHFLRKNRPLSYGFWIAALLVPFALINYLFEAFCPVIFMETLLELNAAEGTQTDTI